MRARRLVAVASVAVGLVALSGCRSEPGVAAYVGDQRITEEAVTRILDELRDDAATSTPEQPAPGQPTGQPGAPGEQRLPGRGEVVSTLVLGEVCQRLSADKGYRPQNQVPVEQVSQQLGYPTDTTYPQRVAELYTCLSGVPSGQPVAPTEQEMADLVKAGKAAGAIPEEVTVEQAATQLDGQQLRTALATRNALAEAVEGYDVTVNPRYRPLAFPVLSFAGNVAAVSVPLGEAGSDAVTDAA
ncbi:hypothetical protein CA850_06915 [Micromonospora echinospora]|uniref:Lipoprotein n=1 Tax=Micromonospora echinospora TaxID=1877 RepID=A0A1C4VB57_MICEC|nr:hypothetical protein [Micromonospora echinospora]OZV83373.1 hypothetical protein CA850_06915 [Micromonospora echinospora]SCE81061.1 hypothetical protein GA0070618_1098 [Micromonospora echinospora]